MVICELRKKCQTDSERFLKIIISSEHSCEMET